MTEHTHAAGKLTTRLLVQQDALAAARHRLLAAEEAIRACAAEADELFRQSREEAEALRRVLPPGDDVRAETARIHEDERQRLFLLRQETLRQTEEFLQESHAGLLAEEALQAEISAGLAAVRVQKDRLTARRAAQATRGLRVLQLLTWILPRNERADWLQERRAFLYDLPAARDRIRWIIGDLCGLPRQAYALRTGTEKEPA